MKKIIKLFNWDKSDLVKVLFGSFLSCLAVNIFIVPNNLYTGGVLGIAQLTRSIINTIFNIQTKQKLQTIGISYRHIFTDCNIADTIILFV